MNELFNARDITGFLDVSIGSFLREIEDIAIEMSKTDDYEERINLMNDIQHVIWKCNRVLK